MIYALEGVLNNYSGRFDFKCRIYCKPVLHGSSEIEMCELIKA